jgi:hypothetical protein
MQFRYMGFEQARNIRSYRFDGVAQGELTRRFVVAVDLDLFLKHHVGVQEGPSMCVRKLSTDGGPDNPRQELTNDDLLAYVSARSLAEERKASSRRGHRKATVPAPSAV